MIVSFSHIAVLARTRQSIEAAMTRIDCSI
jgi:hypothetical protein